MCYKVVYTKSFEALTPGSTSSHLNLLLLLLLLYKDLSFLFFFLGLLVDLFYCLRIAFISPWNPLVLQRIWHNYHTIFYKNCSIRNMSDINALNIDSKFKTSVHVNVSCIIVQRHSNKQLFLLKHFFFIYWFSFYEIIQRSPLAW